MKASTVSLRVDDKNSQGSLQSYCEICNAASELYYRMNGINLFRCSYCRFIFSDRNPNNSYNYETDFYSEIAERAKRIHKFYAQARMCLILKYLPDAKSLLDIGCSSGIFLHAIKDVIPEPRGIDISASAIHEAKIKGLNVEFKGVFEEQGQYDVLTMIEVVEHFDDMNRLFAKLNSLCNENGIIFFQTGNTTSLEFFLRQKEWKYFDPPAHCSYLSYRSTKLLLVKNNFKLLYFGGGVDLWSYLKTPNKPYSRLATIKGLIGKLHIGGLTVPSSMGVIARKVS